MTLAELFEGQLVAPLDEVWPHLRIKRSAAYAAASRGQIPTVRLGRKLFVPIPALLKMLGGEAFESSESEQDSTA